MRSVAVPRIACRRAARAGLVVLVLTTCAPRAEAATFIVNSIADTTDGSCTAVAGGCTLREAMAAAVATAGRDTIAFDPTVFPPGAPGVISLFMVTDPISDAAGTVLDGAGAGVVIEAANQIGPSPDPLVFASTPGVPLTNVTVANVTVRNFLGSGIVICGGEFPGCDEDVSATVVQNVVATGNGGSGIKIDGRVVTKTRIVGSVAVASGGTGIDVNGSQSQTGTRVESCDVRDNAGNGIGVNASADTVGTVVSACIAVHNGASGIRINADQRLMKSKVTNVTVIRNEIFGVALSAGAQMTATTIANAIGSNNMGYAIDLSSGDSIAGATLKSIVANGNFGGISFSSVGAVTGAKITDVKAAGNEEDGITLSAGTGVSGTKISRALLAANAGIGVYIRGSRNGLSGVHANGNGAGIKLDAPGEGNTIAKSSTNANNGGPGGFGILVASGNTGNVIQKNISLGNDGFDLDDANPACDGNSWKANVFFSRSDDCIH